MEKFALCEHKVFIMGMLDETFSEVLQEEGDPPLL